LIGTRPAAAARDSEHCLPDCLVPCTFTSVLVIDRTQSGRICPLSHRFIRVPASLLNFQNLDCTTIYCTGKSHNGYIAAKFWLHYTEAVAGFKSHFSAPSLASSCWTKSFALMISVEPYTTRFFGTPAAAPLAPVDLVAQS
jgi:hypothetical protein